MAPTEPASISPAEMELCRHLFERRRQFVFQAAGLEFAIAFCPERSTTTGRSMELSIGQFKYVLTVVDWDSFSPFESILGTTQLSGLPDQIFLAALEACLETNLDAMAKNLEAPCELSLASEGGQQETTLGFRLTGPDGALLNGNLASSLDGIRWLIGLYSDRAVMSQDDGHELPILGQVLAGYSMLAPEEIERISPGDVIVVDQACKPSAVWIAFPQNLCWEAQEAATQLALQQRYPLANQVTAGGPSSLLCFVRGTTSLALQQVNELAPETQLTWQPQPQTSVVLDEQTLGFGELVQIGSATGFRVSSWLGRT